MNQQRAYRAKTIGKRYPSDEWPKARPAWVKCRYGIEPEELAAMERSHAGKCGICSGNGKLQIDHCHDSGIVRGLLCHKCNKALGLLGDDPDIIELAAAYLRKHKRTSDVA